VLRAAEGAPHHPPLSTFRPPRPAAGVLQVIVYGTCKIQYVDCTCRVARPAEYGTEL